MFFSRRAAVCIAASIGAKGLPDAVKSFLGAAAAFAALEAADEFIPYPIVAGPHAAVAAILDSFVSRLGLRVVTRVGCTTQ